MKGNLRSLDALRGLLALYVLMGHARWLLWEGWQTWQRSAHPIWETVAVGGLASFRYGHEAVLVFFALSGYFIHLQAAQKLADGQAPALNVATFYRRRCRRLVPPYGCALLLTVALDLIGRAVYPALYQGTTGDALLDVNFAASGYAPRCVLPALVVLPRSLGWGFGSNGPLWSLAYEMVYYAVYPLWLACRRRGGWLAYGFFVPMGLLLACLPRGGGFIFDVAVSYPVWLLGAATAEYFSRLRAAPWLNVAALCGAATLVLPAATPAGRVFYNTLGGASCVLLFAGLPAWLSQRLGERWLGFFGARSYSIYILHFPVLALLSAGVFAHWGGRPANPLLWIPGALLAIGIAVGCFHWVERPFLSRQREKIIAETTG